jgi:hypothetical protein
MKTERVCNRVYSEISFFGEFYVMKIKISVQ